MTKNVAYFLSMLTTVLAFSTHATASAADNDVCTSDESTQTGECYRWQSSIGIVDNGIIGIEVSTGIAQRSTTKARGILAYATIRDFGSEEPHEESSKARERQLRSTEYGVRFSYISMLIPRVIVASSSGLGALRLRVSPQDRFRWHLASSIDIGIGTLSVSGKGLVSAGIALRSFDLGGRSVVALPAGQLRSVSLGNYIRAEFLL